MRNFTLKATVVANEDETRKFLSKLNDALEGVLQDEKTMKGVAEVDISNWIEDVERLPKS